MRAFVPRVLNYCSAASVRLYDVQKKAAEESARAAEAEEKLKQGKAMSRCVAERARRELQSHSQRLAEQKQRRESAAAGPVAVQMSPE